MEQPLTIGVAIPCYKYHTKYIQRCLESLEAQTRKPDQVVISCSSSEPEEIPPFSVSFPVTVLPTSLRKNAAENRNLASKALSTSIVSFFDVDDVMHPQRLEAIQTAFQTYPVTQIVLHSYTDGEEANQPFQHYSTFDMSPNQLQRAPSGCAIYIPNWRARIHHSQVSVSSSLAQSIRFPEGQAFERKEDAVFCGNVLAIPNVQSVYLPQSFSKYFMEGATH